MKLFALAWLALAATSSSSSSSSYTLALPSVDAAKKTQIAYEFERGSTAGVEGAISIRHSDADKRETAAWVLASLDFRDLDLEGVRNSDPQCKSLKDVMQFQYHIHVHWNASPASKTSDAFAGCGKLVTGNHYDPEKACGPSSEFAGTKECEGRASAYKCTPAAYAKDHSVCEKGDLSGKGGNFVLGENGFVVAEWRDSHFPLPSERTPHWSIVLHAVCGSATPRIACAVGVETEQRASDDEAYTIEEYTGEYDAGIEWIDELRA